jgi:hypothetical protein
VSGPSPDKLSNIFEDKMILELSSCSSSPFLGP